MFVNSVQKLYVCVISAILSPLDKSGFSNLILAFVISVILQNGEHVFTISYNSTPRAQTFVETAWNLPQVKSSGGK